MPAPARSSAASPSSLTSAAQHPTTPAAPVWDLPYRQQTARTGRPEPRPRKHRLPETKNASRDALTTRDRDTSWVHQGSEFGDAVPERLSVAQRRPGDLGVAARPLTRGPAAGEEVDVAAGPVHRAAGALCVAGGAGEHDGATRAPPGLVPVDFDGDGAAAAGFARGDGDRAVQHGGDAERVDGAHRVAARAALPGDLDRGG